MRPLLRPITTALLAAAMMATSARAEKRYDPGATDSEIKIGQISSDAAWAEAYRVVGRAEAAYFDMVNDRGGVRGRKIRFVSVDGGTETAGALEAARRLVEQEGVLLIFSSFGTENNLAIRPYLNERRVPQLFVESSSAVFDQPARYPWTMGFFATYRTEGSAYARYILQDRPHARIAVLYADDDAGREYLEGVRQGLGAAAAAMIAREEAYRTDEPKIEEHLLALKNSGADVFLNLSLGTFATAAIRGAYDLDWHPLQFIPNASLSTAAFLDPAGLDKARGIVSNARSKSWSGPTADSDPDVREFLAWMSRYNPQASLRDQTNVAGYERAEALVAVLAKCGDDLSRANVMRQAASLDTELGMLRPGIRVKTGPGDFQPIKQLFLIRFNGRSWGRLGPVIGE
jgi:branched-chain amino acid transport system substrate-binding protein